MLVCDWCGTPQGKHKIKKVPVKIDASNSSGGVMVERELCTKCREAINEAIVGVKREREREWKGVR